MADSEHLISDIKNKILSMSEDRSALEKEYASMTARLQEMKTELDTSALRLKEMEKEVEVTKMARTIAGDESSKNIEARAKINEMVKEIDKCIAMLNS